MGDGWSSVSARAGVCRALLVACVAGLAVLSLPASAGADARTDYLVKLLSGSDQFRVRVQAAISLANVGDSPPVQSALRAALDDAHPAVRAAAASSLGRLGNPAAMAALRDAADDPERPVKVAVEGALAKLAGAARRAGGAVGEPPAAPRGPPRFYVAVGRPASNVQGLSADVLASAETFLQQRLQDVDGVVLAPTNESPSDAKKVLKRRKLKGYYIESSVTSVEKKPGGGTRAAVSVILATYPGRDMRAILNGAATVIGMAGSVEEQAVRGALNGALRKLPQALGR